MLTLYKQTKSHIEDLIHYNKRINPINKLDGRTIIDEGDSLDDVFKKLKDPEMNLPILESLDNEEWYEVFGKEYEQKQYDLVDFVWNAVIEDLRDWIEIQHHEAMCEYHDNKQLRDDPHGYYGVSKSDFI